METVVLGQGVINAKFVSGPRRAERIVQKALSYMVKGAEHTELFKSKRWDGRSSFYSGTNKQFPAGFVGLVSAQLRKHKYSVSVKRAEAPEPQGPERPLIDAFGYDDARYAYQPGISDTFARHKRMICQVATGGGKSRIARIVTARVNRPTLFLTTRKVLMYQMKGHYEDMQRSLGRKRRIGVIGDSEWDPVNGINVGMVQTLASMLLSDKPAKRKKAKEFLRKVELVILEEAHEASGDSFYNVMNVMRNAHYRLALTATPFMKDDQEANMRLMAVTGAIGARVTEKQLIDSGILAEPFFKIIDPGASKGLYRGTAWQRAYNLGIVESAGRNAKICAEAERASLYDISVLVLVQRKKHGALLAKQLRERGMTAEFIWGDSKGKERTKTLKQLGNGEIDVLIGSTILDVGVDVPSIGMIILAGGGKAEVGLRQRVGRGLRAKATGPNKAFIVDFNDRHNEILWRHSQQRQGILDATPGFAERVLSTSQDFDFTGFQRVR